MRLLALLLGFGLLGCSVNHRSGDFACTTQADCLNGRTCSDGLCVLPDDAGHAIDARTTDGGGGLCPAQCTSCDLGSKTCVVDCAVNPSLCATGITCPSEFNCNVKCTAISDCRTSVNCTNARSCNITCSGTSSCRNVTCGGGPCTVECSGVQSCRNVSCGLSCACDVSCSPGATCSGVACKSAACTTTNPFGCTSKLTGCNSCP